MITSTVGKIFLDAYNEKYGTAYDARTFFLEKFYEMFFNHEKYMMTAGNSPLEDPKISWDNMIIGKKPFENDEQRTLRFNKFMSKIDKGQPDASIARGYPTVDTTTATSSQVTNLHLPLDTESFFLSWIGDGLGVGVTGGVTILFFKKEILLDIFDGWQIYRQMLQENRELKGNQINTWNGQWLAHYYDTRMFNSQNPLSGFNPFSDPKDGIIELDTQSWTRILIGIARKYPDTKLMGYVYNIGQTNITVGFIPFDLTQIRRPLHLYEKFFGMDTGHQAESLWGTAKGFKYCCAKGSIGLKAMQPKDLSNYITHKRHQKNKNNNNEQTIKFNVYQIWLLAMLNNDQLWDKSQSLAQLLHEALCNKTKSLSTKPKNIVDNVLSAVNKKQFIANATELLPLVSDCNTFEELVKDIHQMPNDNVPYFLTLLRFHFNLTEQNYNK